MKSFEIPDGFLFQHIMVSQLVWASLLFTVSKDPCKFHSDRSYCSSRGSVNCALL